MLGVHPKEPVVVEEPKERDRRKGQNQLGRRAPDGGAHGGEVEREEIVSVAAPAHVLAERHVRNPRILERRYGLLIEPVY